MLNQLALFFLVLFISQSCGTKEHTLESVKGFKDFTPLESIRLNYGNDSLQFGDLRLPQGEDKAPVIMIIHGGCWLSQYDLSLMDSMAHDLSAKGYATWNIEYRRTEDPGGAWPGTFTDVANALKYLSSIAENYPIDINQVYLTGHSAGGHLALWLGAQGQLNEESELKVQNLPKIQGILSLAGITDLQTYYSPSGCGNNVKNLIGGIPDELRDRYEEASPISYLPLNIPQILVNGDKDFIVPIEHIQPYYEKAKFKGDSIQLLRIPSAGHFEVITPGSTAWTAIINAFEELIHE
jgi:acetyl esterase/lipase